MSKRKIKVDNLDISIISKEGGDFISLTDIARKFTKVPKDILKSYFRNSQNIEYLAAWENLHNEQFKADVADQFKLASIKNSFSMSVKQWVEKTNAIGVYATHGRLGATYAHKDIAFQFAMWLSPVFQLYIVKEFDRLKMQEEKNARFYLNKIFDHSLESTQLSKFLLDNQTLPDDDA